MHDSGNLVGALDHVIVGNNQAAGIDDEALAAESLLRLRSQELLATRKADDLAYRNRLVAALSGAYPVVAAWLEASP